MNNPITIHDGTHKYLIDSDKILLIDYGDPTDKNSKSSSGQVIKYIYFVDSRQYLPIFNLTDEELNNQLRIAPKD